MSRTTITVEFRPIVSWPGELRGWDRKSSPFQSSYDATVDLLLTEVDHLGAKAFVVELAVTSAEIRADGMPRARMYPAHPGVIVSFDSTHGPLRYWTDRFTSWQANLRAIALGLEALRKIDRYGISERGEQYSGWSALPPGTITAPPASMTLDEAERFVLEQAGDGGMAGSSAAARAAHLRRCYRWAAKRLHPDAGGDVVQFQRLEEAWRLIREQGAA